MCSNRYKLWFRSIKECQYVYQWCHHYLGQEAFHGRIRGDGVQEGRHELPEPRRRYADQERPVVAEADVVGVTNHVVHDDLLGTSLRALQPIPEERQRQLGACVWVCAGMRAFLPQNASDAGLRKQQEVLVWRQGDAVGHVERVQQDLHTSCLRIEGQETAEVVQLDHLQHRQRHFGANVSELNLVLVLFFVVQCSLA